MRLLRNTKTRPISGVSFGPDGLTLVAGGSGGFDLWNLKSSSRKYFPSHSVQYLYGCVYHPFGRWVYLADYIGGFRFLSLDGKTRTVPGSSHQRHVTTFDITTEGD